MQVVQEFQGLQFGQPEGGGDEIRKENFVDEGQNQTSFIVIDNGEGVVPSDNDQQPKKSDRSSDESSYDVIDDEQLVEETVDDGEGAEGSKRDKGGHALDSGSELKQPEQDPFLDTTETCMVIIEDSDHSGLSKSEASFYAPADEAVASEGRLKEKSKDETEVEEVSEECVTVTDVEDTAESLPGAADVSSSQDDSRLEGAIIRDSDVTEQSVSTVTEEPVAESPQVDDGTKSPGISAVLESEPDVTQDVELGVGDITEVLTACQNSPSTVSKEDIRRLVDLLRKKIPELHSTVLNSLLRVAAFTQNIVSA